MPKIVAKSSCKLFTLPKMYDDYYTTHTIPKPIFEYQKLLTVFSKVGRTFFGRNLR